MANELVHGSVGTELTQAEWEGVGTHVFNSQATGDIVYASSSSQLSRLAKGTDTHVLILSSGIPAWSTSTGITALGTIATGTWQGTDVGVAYGGTGVSTLAANSVLTGNGASAITAETNLTFDGSDLSLGNNIGAIFGDAGEKIEGDGTDLTIASSGYLKITTTDDVLIGTGTPVTVGGLFDGGSTGTPELQVAKNSDISNMLLSTHHTTDGYSSTFAFLKSGNATIGSFTTVADNEDLGNIVWVADDGADYAAVAARILVEVDGTVATNKIPGRISLMTTLAGATSPTTRMQIKATGEIDLQSNALGLTNVGASGNDWTATAFTHDGAATFNDSGGNYDFRVEGDTNANMIMVDASRDVISFGVPPSDDRQFYVSPQAITATADTNFSRMYLSSQGAVTIPSGTAAHVSTLTIEEPWITATGTVTTSSTLRIVGAATEGTNDYALWVDAGLSRFDGNINLNDNDLLNVGASGSDWDSTSLRNAGDYFGINGKGMVIGHSAKIADIGGSGLTPEIQVQGTGQGDAAIGIGSWGDASVRPRLVFFKTEQTTIGGGKSIVGDGDSLGMILFAGDDGVDYATSAVRLEAFVDGTPGSNDMPGRFTISTTADGASSVTERMRIHATGEIDLKSNALGLTNVGASGNDWTAAGITYKGTGGAKFEKTTGATTGLDGFFSIQLTTSGNMADTFGPTMLFFIEDGSAADQLIGHIAFERAGADNTGDFILTTVVSGTQNQAFKVTSAGVGSFDLSGSGSAAQVDLFDDYDDPVELQRYTHMQSDRFTNAEERQISLDRMVDMGVVSEVPNASSGYHMNLQPMIRLLSGGIYQNRERIDAQHQAMDARLRRIEQALGV